MPDSTQRVGTSSGTQLAAPRALRAPRQPRRDPVPLPEGEGALTGCFISSRCLKPNPQPRAPSSHLGMNPGGGHGCTGSAPPGRDGPQ